MKSRLKNRRLKKRRNRRVLALFIFLFGTILLLYPSVERLYSDYQLSMLRKEFFNDISSHSFQEDLEFEMKIMYPTYTMQRGMKTGSIMGEEVPTTDDIIDVITPEEIVTVEKPSLTRQEINERIKNRWEVEGMLEIPSIDLILPIIENATMRHLRVSAASILETTKPWSEEIGNYVVTAHRSRRRGRHFNRLGEIAIGERIILTDTRGIVYEYEVYEIKIVHETDMSIL
ncbi:MAG: sortase, partial [Clostridiales bacterium]|nr:sortase [Clostridiales bacterium]